MNAEKQVLRSAEKEFNFSTNCFYCGEPAISGRKRKGTHKLFLSGQLKQRIQHWQYVMKEGMIGQMLCKQEFYMCTIYMLQMQYIIEYAVIIFIL